jgi:hypothetical protein
MPVPPYFPFPSNLGGTLDAQFLRFSRPRAGSGVRGPTASPSSSTHPLASGREDYEKGAARISPWDLLPQVGWHPTFVGVALVAPWAVKKPNSWAMGFGHGGRVEQGDRRSGLLLWLRQQVNARTGNAGIGLSMTAKTTNRSQTMGRRTGDKEPHHTTPL